MVSYIRTLYTFFVFPVSPLSQPTYAMLSSIAKASGLSTFVKNGNEYFEMKLPVESHFIIAHSFESNTYMLVPSKHKSAISVT